MVCTYWNPQTLTLFDNRGDPDPQLYYMYTDSLTVGANARFSRPGAIIAASELNSLASGVDYGNMYLEAEFDYYAFWPLSGAVAPKGAPGIAPTARTLDQEYLSKQGPAGGSDSAFLRQSEDKDSKDVKSEVPLSSPPLRRQEGYEKSLARNSLGMDTQSISAAGPSAARDEYILVPKGSRAPANSSGVGSSK